MTGDDSGDGTMSVENGGDFARSRRVDGKDRQNGNQHRPTGSPGGRWYGGDGPCRLTVTDDRPYKSTFFF